MKPRDSSDAEIQALEALCERLAGFDDRVSLEWLDGCMAALLAGPRALLPTEWLPQAPWRPSTPQATGAGGGHLRSGDE